MTLRETVGWEIRNLGSEDLDKVVRVNTRCLPEHYPHFFYLDLYERFPRTFLVAETGTEEIVGYIMCRVERGFSAFGFLKGLAKKGHIISVAVLPEWRRQGVASSLVRHSIQSMRDHYNCDESFLEVRVSNVPAIRLYEDLGFEKTKRSANYYRDGEEAYVMARRIH